MNVKDEGINCLAFKLMWAALALAITLAISGGGLLVAQIRNDMDAGARREAKIVALEVGHEGFEKRMARFEDKLDKVLDLLGGRK
jgi:hypothetical protein